MRKEESKEALFEKSAQKLLLAAGVVTGSAFNRHQRWRLKALPATTPAANKVFLVTFFSKKVTAS